MNGLTGYPLIDACMRELKTTGFLQDRCRLLAASFLCNDLHYEWTYGANYFECACIDYNVFCNWVNWAMVAGLTHGHCFDKLHYKHEYKLYDPDGEYIRLWVQELQHLPKEFVVEPWKMTPDDEAQYNFRYGKDYPYRIVLPRVKATPHRNEDDVIVIREMLKRKISVRGIKNWKQFIMKHGRTKKLELPPTTKNSHQEVES
jgi:deoxyribodipyrimidine photolyase